VYATSGRRRTLLAGGCVIRMDSQVGDLRLGDILIEGDRIAAIGPAIDASDAARIDASDFVVLPGFVDTHRHTWQSCLRHRMGDAAFWTYCADMLRDLGPKYTAKEVYVGTLLAPVSAIEAGTTTMVDWSHSQNSLAHADAAV